eukprot:2234853-Rhodomonas_salina.1
MLVLEEVCCGEAILQRLLKCSLRRGLCPFLDSQYKSQKGVNAGHKMKGYCRVLKYPGPTVARARHRPSIRE